jgi:uncharacterized RDD family membrane protein YckC
MSADAVETPATVRYAGFWLRLFANWLDVLVIAAVNMALMYATGAQPEASRAARPELLLSPVLVILFWVSQGATPGKMLCRLRIVDEVSGGRPSLWQCIGRYMMAVVVMGLAGIGYLWIAIDPRKQGWHDKVVRTLVVKR